MKVWPVVADWGAEAGYLVLVGHAAVGARFVDPPMFLWKNRRLLEGNPGGCTEEEGVKINKGVLHR
jgi:hypothetical protein